MTARASAVFGLVMMALGVAILARALTSGAGPLSYGVLLGVLFVLAGAGRFWIAREKS
jgi:fucose permease